MSRVTSKSSNTVAILGGGCAGLSLAVRLLARFDDLNVTVYEARTQFEHDRSWCYWRFGPTDVDHLVTHRWRTLQLRDRTRDVRIDCGPHPYCYVPSDRFYRWALERLDRTGRCDLRLGTRVDAISEHANEVIVHARSAGRSPRDTRAFTRVFDGRPPARLPRDKGVAPLIFQHFAGRVVRFDRDVLDPERATLMDFTVDQADGLHFAYVLPFSSRDALVESTYMTPDVDPDAPYETTIQQYCTSALGAVPVAIDRIEQGCLPMTRRPLAPPSTRRVWQIGARAGVARASTGYAFDAIQRDTDGMCDALAQSRRRPRPPRPRMLDLLDGVFLSLLRTRQELAPELFARMFTGTATPVLLRFLNDRASLLDMIRVGWSLPKTLLTTHIVTHPRSCFARGTFHA